MVATRRGTRVGPPVEAEGDGGERTSSEAASLRQTRSTVKRDSQAEVREESSQDHSKSSVSLTKTEALEPQTRTSTRSRHRSGQSDISEAESSTSNQSTRVTRSRQSLTDTVRNLRSCKSSVVTEPILESKEDEVLSEAESYCSSVSTSDRRTHASISRSARASARRSALVSVLDSDHSEAESQDISEAESLSSGFTSQPLIKRSTRIIQYKLQTGIAKGASETTSPVQTSPKQQKPNLRGVKVTEPLSPGQQQTAWASPRRSLRNRRVRRGSEVMVGSSKDSNEDMHIEQVEECLDNEKCNLTLEDNTELVPEQPETSDSINKHSADKIIDLTQEIEDEQDQCEVVEEEQDQIEVVEEEDEEVKTADGTSKEPKSVELCLKLDSESEQSENDAESEKKKEGSHKKSEGSEAETDVEKEAEESHKELEKSEAESDVEMEKSHVNIPTKTKPKGVPSRQLQGDAIDVEKDDEESHDELGHSKAKADVEKEAKENHDELGHGEAEAYVEKEEEECHEESEHSEAEADVEKEGGESHEESEQSDAESDIEMEEESHEELENSEVESVVEMEEESHVSIPTKSKPKRVPAHQLQEGASDGLFVIDTAPGLDTSKKYYLDHEGHKESVDEQEEEEQEEEKSDNDEEDFIDEDDEADDLLNRPKKGLTLSTSIDTGLSVKEMGGLYISFDAGKPNPRPMLNTKMKKHIKKDELLKKSVITPDFEKKDAVPPYRESLNKLKKKRKEEREKTTGRGWFDMKAPELTEEMKNDLKALKMRSAMDPKRFYKKNDREGFPKYFQVGTVVDNPIDFYHSRIPKKQRKRTLVEELLADSEFRRYNKKKYQGIIAEKAARAEGKKNRKKKKFQT